MTAQEWAGVGLFTAALALGAAALGMWRFIGWAYALPMTLEGLAFGGLGVAIATGNVPLNDRQPVVVAVALVAVATWHVGAVAMWPPPQNQSTRR